MLSVIWTAWDSSFQALGLATERLQSSNFVLKIKCLWQKKLADEPGFTDIGDDIQLNKFWPVSLDDMVNTIKDSPSKQCELGPLPTWMFKECVSTLETYITNLINVSLSSGHFPEIWKHANVSPIPKKPRLDKFSSTNY